MQNPLSKYITLTEDQIALLEKYVNLLIDWNNKINLISRQDIENIWERHILHSLTITKIIDFKSAKVIDVGTGGGLPGIPLAIYFPQAHFTLIDSIGKKITALQDIIHRLNLPNATALHANSKQIKEKYHFVVARAVTDFRKFYKLTKHLISTEQSNASLNNGIIYLKGGDFEEEIKPFAKKIKIYNISQWIDLPFFETKKIIYLPL